MREILELTSVKMTPPKPYGVFHLTFFIIGMIVCVHFAKKLSKISDKQNKIFLFFIGLFLLIIEIYKQLFYFYVVNNGHYDCSLFPFQLCDVPMFLCLIAPFVKNKKIEEAMYNFMVSYNLLGGFITFLEPSSLCRPYLTMTLHGFLWHMILVFIGLYLAFSNRCLKNKRDFLTSVRVYGFLCVIALLLNTLLRNVSMGDLNAFYLGPTISPVVIFSDISARFGWFINMIIFVLVMTLGAYFVYLLLYNKEKIKLFVKGKVSVGLKNES